MIIIRRREVPNKWDKFKKNLGRNLAKGVFMGGMVGGLSTAAWKGNKVESDNTLTDIQKGDKILKAGGVGALIGAGLGAGLGAIFSYDRGEPLESKINREVDKLNGVLTNFAKKPEEIVSYDRTKVLRAFKGMPVEKEVTNYLKIVDDFREELLRHLRKPGSTILDIMAAWSLMAKPVGLPVHREAIYYTGLSFSSVRTALQVIEDYDKSEDNDVIGTILVHHSGEWEAEYFDSQEWLENVEKRNLKELLLWQIRRAIDIAQRYKNDDDLTDPESFQKNVTLLLKSLENKIKTRLK